MKPRLTCTINRKAHDPKHSRSSVKQGGGNLTARLWTGASLVIVWRVMDVAGWIVKYWLILWANSAKCCKTEAKGYSSMSSQSTDRNPTGHGFRWLHTRLNAERPTKKQLMESTALSSRFSDVQKCAQLQPLCNSLNNYEPKCTIKPICELHAPDSKHICVLMFTLLLPQQDTSMKNSRWKNLLLVWIKTCICLIKTMHLN